MQNELKKKKILYQVYFKAGKKREKTNTVWKPEFPSPMLVSICINHFIATSPIAHHILVNNYEEKVQVYTSFQAAKRPSDVMKVLTNGD